MVKTPIGRTGRFYKLYRKYRYRNRPPISSNSQNKNKGLNNSIGGWIDHEEDVIRARCISQFQKWERSVHYISWKKHQSRVQWIGNNFQSQLILKVSNGDKRKRIKKSTEVKVKRANDGKYATKLPSHEYETSESDIISFEHINVNGLSSKNDLIEVKHLLGTLTDMEAGIYSVSEHTLDSTQASLRKNSVR